MPARNSVLAWDGRRWRLELDTDYPSCYLSLIAKNAKIQPGAECQSRTRAHKNSIKCACVSMRIVAQEGIDVPYPAVHLLTQKCRVLLCYRIYFFKTSFLLSQSSGCLGSNGFPLVCEASAVLQLCLLMS